MSLLDLSFKKSALKQEYLYDIESEDNPRLVCDLKVVDFHLLEKHYLILTRKEFIVLSPNKREDAIYVDYYVRKRFPFKGKTIIDNIVLDRNGKLYMTDYEFSRHNNERDVVDLVRFGTNQITSIPKIKSMLASRDYANRICETEEGILIFGWFTPDHNLELMDTNIKGYKYYKPNTNRLMFNKSITTPVNYMIDEYDYL